MNRLVLTSLLLCGTAALTWADTPGVWDERFGNYEPEYTPGDVVEWNGRLVTTAGFYSDVVSNEERFFLWDGNRWAAERGPFDAIEEVFVGLWGQVAGLAVFEDQLVVAGYAHDWSVRPDGPQLSQIASWDGNTWTPLGDPIPARAIDVFVHGSELYLTALFAETRGSEDEFFGLARFDGSGWEVLATGFIWYTPIYSDGENLLLAGTDIVPASLDTLTGVVAFDGQDWRVVADLPPAPVRALTRFEGDLVAGSQGRDPGLDLVYRLRADTWESMGLRIPGEAAPEAAERDILFRHHTVSDFEAIDGRLTAAGYFPDVGGTGTGHVAAWAGDHWEVLDGGTNGSVAEFARWRGRTLIYGGFSQAGTRSVNGLAEWNGSAWAELKNGEGLRGEVFDLLVHDEAVWAVGRIRSAGGEPVHGLVRWNGWRWEEGNIDPRTCSVLGLSTDGDDLLAAGRFAYPDADTTAHSPVARFKDGEWVPVLADWGTGAADEMVAWDGKVAVWWRELPSFEVRSRSTLGILDVETGEVRSFALNDRGGINAFEVWNDRLVVGGTFTMIDGVTVNNLAAFDGESWDPLEGGAGGSVHALAVVGGDLVVGGHFNVVGPYVDAKSIARFDGTEWWPYGEGFTDSDPGRNSSVAVVHAVVKHGGQLFAAGNFDGSADTELMNLARWDGRQWYDVGSGASSGPPWFAGEIRALVSWRGDVYAGGLFSRAGEMNSSGFARWIMSPPDLPSSGVVLRSIAPNPLNPTTTIYYSVSRRDHVSLDIFDLRGRKVVTLLDEWLDAGPNSVQWAGVDHAGRGVASGVYIVHVSGAGGTDRGKVTVVK